MAPRRGAAAGRDPSAPDDGDSDDEREHTTEAGGGDLVSVYEDVLDLLNVLSLNEEWMARGFWTADVVREMMPLFILVKGMNHKSPVRVVQCIASAGELALPVLCDYLGDPCKPALKQVAECIARITAPVCFRLGFQPSHDAAVIDANDAEKVRVVTPTPLHS